MASVTRNPRTKFWQIHYRDAAGRQHKRSSKIEHSPSAATPKERAALAAENKRAAQHLADELERAERGNPTEAQLRRMFAELSERLVGARITAPACRAYLEQWLDERQLTPASRQRYAKPIAAFLESMGKRAEQPIDSVTPADLNAYFQARLKAGITASTIDVDRRTLNAAFNSAHRAGLLQSNPVTAAEPIRAASEERQPFTPAEVERLLTEAEGTDWQAAIALAAYAGMRLGDAVNLTWAEVDLFTKRITFRPRKTRSHKRDLVLPLGPRLAAILADRHAATGGKGDVTPTLAGKSAAGKSGLSMAFARLMERAGIDAGKVEADGEQARAFSRKSFHSLRHFFVSQLAAAGVAPDVRMALAGHSTAAAHGKYSHLQLETLARAVANL